MSNLFKSKFLLGLVMVFAFVAFAATANAYTFTTSMKLGTKSQAVMELQKVLNGAGYTVSTTGAGSPGMESTYFGAKTKAAVMKWQAAVGLSADGNVGPASRAALNATTPVSGNLPAGCTSTAGFSSITGVKCDGTTGGNTSTQTGPVTAMLATTNPASSTLVAGQATANLAQFTFNGTGTVTGVTLQRTGVSADTTPSNVYLFDGATRLTDAASVSNNGTVTFNTPAGIFMVNGSKTISVKSDIASSTSGQTVGMTLATFTTSAGTVTANLSGNIHSIASVSNLAAVTLSGTITPSGATLNPGANVTLWQGTLNISQRDVMMKRLALRNVGSAPANAFANFKLYVNGVQVGSATGVDMNGYVTFDLMSSPVTLASGSRVVRIDADIISGASRTVEFSLRNAADVDLVDSSFGVNITPALTGTALPWKGTASNIGGATGGSLTVEKDVSSPSTNVTLSGSDMTLGVFKLTAYGEPVKVETLTAGHTTSVTATLRNGRLLVSTDGVTWTQYGSTSTILAAGTSYTLNYTVNPGTPVWVKVNSDIYDNDGTQSIVGGTTIVANLVTGSSNAQKVDSLGSLNVPLATVSGNTLTAASASATLTANGTYANQNTVIPATNFKVGSWNLAGSSVEDVLLTTLSFDVDEVSGTEFDEGDLTNMYVVVKNGATVVAQPSPLGTVSATDNNFSINYTLAKNSSVTIELFANLSDDGADSAIDAGDSFKTDLTVTGTALVSGISVNASSGDIDGQTIASGAATLTATQDASTPVTAIVYDNQTVTSAAFKFAAVTSAYNVTDLTFTLGSNTVVTSVELYDGATMVASKPGASTVTFNGLNWNVPANQNKVLNVKLVLGTVTDSGSGTTSGASLLTTLTAFTAVNASTGVSDASANDAGPSIENDPAGTAMYVYAATPTITNVTLPSTALLTGTQTVAKFTVASNGGTIGWKKFIFTVTRAMGGTDTLATPTLWDADTNTQIAGTPTFTGSVEADGGTAGTIVFVATNEQQISGTKTYILKVVTAGTLVTGNNINVNIAQPSAFAAVDDYTAVAGTTASFVWSDTSAIGHDAASTTVLDWNNGFLVKNLPTDTQTLTTI